MIIERIFVKNFASYDEAEVDLKALGPLVSIQGPTGSGKTTFFIDAVTLALFGRAFGEDRPASLGWTVPQEGGPTEVMVDFRIGGRRYRLLRKVRRTRDGSYRSEAEMVYLEDSGAVGGSEAHGTKAVDEMVEKLTGLDYLTFRNMVVVRQGEVASILDMDPSKRREVFLRTFAIDLKKHKEAAEKLYEEARRKVDKLESEVEGLEREVARKSEVVSKLNEVQKRLKEVEVENLKVKDRIEVLNEELDDERREESFLKEELGRYEGKLEELEKLHEELSIKKGRANELKEKLKSIDLNELRMRKEKVEEEEAKLTSSMPLLAKVESLQSKLNDLIQRSQSLKEVVKKVEEQAMKVEELKKISTSLNIVKDLLEVKVKELDEAKALLESERGRAKLLTLNIEAIEREEVKDCPICLRPLDLEVKERAVNHLKLELRTIEEKASGLEVKVSSVRKVVEALKKELSLCENAAAQLPEASEKLELLKSQAGEFEKCMFESSKVKQELEEVEGRCIELLGKPLSFEEVQKILRNIKSIKEEVFKKLEDAESYESELKNVDAEVGRLEGRVHELERHVEEVEVLRGQLELKRERIGRLEESLEELRKREGELNKVTGSLEADLRTFRDQLRSIEEAEGELEELREKLDQAHRYVRIYETLYRQVFHERGLPVFLLKEFLSSVEYWSRGYIERLLPGRDLRIDVDDEGRVSIKVLDGTYERDLATYSGGESTLIGFSIRLGIAKSVAVRRLNVAPRFLIIDEGFGPLSREFREDVLKHLKDLAEEYEQILVISHIEDVVENPCFTNTIKVFRDDRGRSRIEIVA